MLFNQDAACDLLSKEGFSEDKICALDFLFGYDDFEVEFLCVCVRDQLS